MKKVHNTIAEFDVVSWPLLPKPLLLSLNPIGGRLVSHPLTNLMSCPGRVALRHIFCRFHPPLSDTRPNYTRGQPFSLRSCPHITYPICLPGNFYSPSTNALRTCIIFSPCNIGFVRRTV
ncbi:hypothetical protein K443DRAFT_235931 [Laccaria amethystina LaAM-08-1]|uniref:Uncharacterized protein n=1 Tax=Laccaria amethystina LaAM-08-1 TaxID=1095629 RepID=A0A0C9XZF7_9AGAR|nr:hypothetical protein K443DRAFT_235931 [Laccaria amethystina LaAM-08-1]